jgi:anti-sigma regulatory factor (Ser/Thr protein kinase)
LTPYLDFPVREESQVGAARRGAVTLATSMGFDAAAIGRVALVVTELATNLVRHAAMGRMLIGARYADDRCLEILSLDAGPGMPEVKRCMVDGYSTAGSSGTGLGAANRQSDEFSIFSAVGKGTVIAARISGSISVQESSAGARVSSGLRVSGICLAAPGETESGDAWGLKINEGKATVIVADGLGHGPSAAAASTTAIETFATSTGPPAAILERCHQALTSTRGAAVAIAELDAKAGKVTFGGAGNVIGRLISGVEDRSLVSQHGTVGMQIRQLRDVAVPWPEHALLVLHSDGIISRWSLADVGGLLQCDPSVIAAWIVRDHTRGGDDVTVVVVKRDMST